MDTQHTFFMEKQQKIVGPVRAVGSVSQLAFGSLQVRFPSLAHSATSCQLLVKGLALSTSLVKSAQEKFG